MDLPIFLYSSLILLFLFISYKFLSKNSSSTLQTINIPPSPPSIPFIGHLHLLKQPLHRTLHSLSRSYGPLFSLRFGSRLVVVVSSFSAAQQCFTGHNDVVLAGRSETIASKYLAYNSTIVGAAPYGPHWRNLRKIGALEIFCPSQVNMFASTRRDEVKILLRKLYRITSRGFAEIELRTLFIEVTYNVIMRMVAGKRYYGEDGEEARKFRAVVEEIMRCAGAGNVEDFIRVLKWVDFRGMVKRMKRIGRESDEILQALVDEQRDCKDGGRDSIIKHLLCLQESQPEYYTDEIIKGFVLALVLAGTDTAAVTSEWAMANLLNNPQLLEKATSELHSKLGQTRLANESDLPNLLYLQSIITETLRLHPPAPLMIPHQASSETTLMGYRVPKDTMVLVNAWTIHRDPEMWDDPARFRPERFEGNGGIGSGMLAFGMGRRACPGAGLANRVVGLMLGGLVQCFEWERVGDVDMAEGSGLTMPKLRPLRVLCRPRSFVCDTFFEEDT